MSMGGARLGFGFTPGGPGSGLTSVGLTMPAIFSVASSPLLSNGTIAVTLATQAANRIFAGPTTGAAATPTFRAMVNADLPASAVAPGTYGDEVTVAQLTVNSKGIVTSAVDVPIVLPSYNEDITVAANPWVIEHSLNKPGVVVVLTDDATPPTQLFAYDLEFTDNNTVTVTFADDMTGVAYVY